MTESAGVVPAEHPVPGSPQDPFVSVSLQRYPLRLGARASQYYAEIFREFALLAADEPGSDDSVPARLLALVDALGRRYARQESYEIERDAALRRGEAERDFVLQLPVSAAEASRAFDKMLDEADDFCREGVLLTLAAPAEIVEFRRWYLAQVVDQIGGAPPRPWSGGLE